MIKFGDAVLVTFPDGNATGTMVGENFNQYETFYQVKFDTQYKLGTKWISAGKVSRQ